MKAGTATVFAAVYSAVLARVAYENGAPISISWEKRRARAKLEAELAVVEFHSYTSGASDDSDE